MDISVIITTHNRQNRVQKAIKSVLNQSYLPKEILVIDDGSTDSTYSVLEKFKDIKYFYKPNGGISSARNFGIKKSKYQWIAFLDDDDEWMSEKLALHVSFHSQNPKTLISYTNERWIRNSVEVNVPKKYSKYGGDIFNKCLNHCIIAPSSVLLNRDLFNIVGYFDESLEVCEDYDLWLKIASLYPIGLIDKALIIKHSHSGEQLGFKHWGMDRFRVKSLENIYANLKDNSQKTELKNVLKKKLNLLIKGAKKHGRKEMALKFMRKLEKL